MSVVESSPIIRFILSSDDSKEVTKNVLRGTIIKIKRYLLYNPSLQGSTKRARSDLGTLAIDNLVSLSDDRLYAQLKKEGEKENVVAVRRILSELLRRNNIHQNRGNNLVLNEIILDLGRENHMNIVKEIYKFLFPHSLIFSKLYEDLSDSTYFVHDPSFFTEQPNMPVIDVNMEKIAVKFSDEAILITTGLGPCIAICVKGKTNNDKTVFGLTHISAMTNVEFAFRYIEAEMLRKGTVLESLEYYVIGEMLVPQEDPNIIAVAAESVLKFKSKYPDFNIRAIKFFTAGWNEDIPVELDSISIKITENNIIWRYGYEAFRSVHVASEGKDFEEELAEKIANAIDNSSGFSSSEDDSDSIEVQDDELQTLALQENKLLTMYDICPYDPFMEKRY